MRLIDADALIECIKDELYDNASFWYKLIADALIKCIQDQPTIEGDTSHVRLGSEANGCWIKCKYCANTRCSRRVEEEDPEPAGYDDSHLDQIVDDMLHGEEDATDD